MRSASCVALFDDNTGKRGNIGYYCNKNNTVLPLTQYIYSTFDSTNRNKRVADCNNNLRKNYKYSWINNTCDEVVKTFKPAGPKGPAGPAGPKGSSNIALHFINITLIALIIIYLKLKYMKKIKKKIIIYKKGT